MEALATKKRKRTVAEEAKELATQEAKAIIVQHKLDKQFARDIEESIYRRGPEAPSISSPTPAPRPKRATVTVNSYLIKRVFTPKLTLNTY